MRFFRGLLVLIAILAIVVAGLIAAFRDPDIPAAMLNAKYGQGASQFVTLPSGANVHYRAQGQDVGPVIVLLHGSNASLHTWEPWVVELADQFRIVTVDLPGHGLTGPVPGDDYSQAGMVKFVDEFATAMKLSTFALGGNSMGGGVAARYAIEHPERLTHLILVDAGGMPTSVERDPGIGFRLARMPIVQNLMLYVTPRRVFEDNLKTAIGDDALVTPEMVDLYWELNRREGNRAASLKRFQTAQDTFVQDNASKIAAPTLILWGELDTLTPPDMGEAYAAAIKGSRLIVYNNVGHIPMEEVSETSSQAVREFMTPTVTTAPR
jgi:pimeloyl-ACP methyl ester carboxylesterase